MSVGPARPAAARPTPPWGRPAAGAPVPAGRPRADGARGTTFTSLVVVPCYDEAARLPRAAFVEFLRERPDVGLVFVDDGSRDATGAVLRALAEEVGAQASVLALPRNRGKAEAVRAGLLHAFAQGATYAGYWDADLATPLEMIPLFAALLDERPSLLVVMGARVKLLGTEIERFALRHYAGRVFATAASLTLRIPVYDTQCGAKLFRATDEVRAAFAEPFLSRWIFDVELLARLLQHRRRARVARPERCMHEYALPKWTDVRGSKVSPRHYVRAGVDLLRIWLRYGRARA